jgi:mannitol/fructose-specific phosphotransferase system IIA component (Ntr-type)
MKLSDFLKKEYVKIINNGGKTKEEIINEISKFIAQVHKTLDERDVARALIEREKKGSTGLGKGLAVPHGRSPNVSGMHVCVIYYPSGKNFDSYDKKPSYLFFSAVTSEDYSPHEQLEILRIIAEIFEKTDISETMKSVKTAEELFNLLIKKEEELSRS